MRNQGQIGGNMSDSVTNIEIEDVLSSIRRLVSEEARKSPADAGAAKEPGDAAQGRLVLTPALRVASDPAGAATDPLTMDEPAAETEAPENEAAIDPVFAASEDEAGPSQEAVEPEAETTGFEPAVLVVEEHGAELESLDVAVEFAAAEPAADLVEPQEPEPELTSEQAETEHVADPSDDMAGEPVRDEPVEDALDVADIAASEPADVETETDAAQASDPSERAPWHDPNATLFSAAAEAIHRPDEEEPASTDMAEAVEPVTDETDDIADDGVEDDAQAHESLERCVLPPPEEHGVEPAPETAEFRDDIAEPFPDEPGQAADADVADLPNTDEDADQHADAENPFGADQEAMAAADHDAAAPDEMQGWPEPTNPEPVAAAPDTVQPETNSIRPTRAPLDGLAAKIAALENRLGRREEVYDPDEPGTSAYAGVPVGRVAWSDTAAPEAADDEPGPADEIPADEARREAEEANADIFSTDEMVLDEDTLRELVTDIVREELQGALGERITRNVRKLVRREINRALAAQELD